MGSCLSKKSTSVSSPKPPEQIESNTQLEKKKAEEGEETIKKEVLVMKHRKSHEVERRSVDEKFEAQKPIDVVETGNSNNNNEIKVELGVVTVATPVRTSSCSKEEVDAILIQCGRLSRSSSAGKVGLSVSGGESHQRVRKYSGSKRSFDFDCENGDVEKDGVKKERESKRESSRTGGSQGRRRRTPSRERDQHRSGSRERGSGGCSGGGGGRRVSRSPGRRSESPISNTSSAPNSNAVSCRPEKMVSVPPTVSSLAMDKSNNAGLGTGGGGSRGGASPRARSPARANQKTSSLSRSNSRKAEQSPYRRNPLSEIDNNIVVKSVNNIAASHSQVPKEKANAIAEQSKGNKTHTRSRSFRQSQDLDNKAESENPSSYTALLLEDIQSFHQKNPTFTLPPSVTKACSILEAVADLNGSDLFGEEDKSRKPVKSEDPIVESEVVGDDDLMQPSFHKYVTLRRRGTANDDFEDQESSGSNSFVGLSSSWEPNSVDSTDRSISSMSRSSRASNAVSHSGIGRGRVGS